MSHRARIIHAFSGMEVEVLIVDRGSGAEVVVGAQGTLSPESFLMAACVI